MSFNIILSFFTESSEKNSKQGSECSETVGEEDHPLSCLTRKETGRNLLLEPAIQHPSTQKRARVVRQNQIKTLDILLLLQFSAQSFVD